MRNLLFVLALLTVLPESPASAAVSVPLTDVVEPIEYTLQVATYSSRTQAADVLSALPDAWVEEVRKDGSTLYRVNYKRFRDRNAALRAQWDLEDLGYKSFVQRLYT
ncbi:MAG: SPOR domain-containing protein [Rhodothermales bacterium]|nr:SPOR domain-containing protein [Rhodothermales bacterium]MBO6780221.1 SPOR domain-containing protein [Rhodothermales bacterium]